MRTQDMFDLGPILFSPPPSPPPPPPLKICNCAWLFVRVAFPFWRPAMAGSFEQNRMERVIGQTGIINTKVSGKITGKFMYRVSHDEFTLDVLEKPISIVN